MFLDLTFLCERQRQRGTRELAFTDVSGGQGLAGLGQEPGALSRSSAWMAGIWVLTSLLAASSELVKRKLLSGVVQDLNPGTQAWDARVLNNVLQSSLPEQRECIFPCQAQVLSTCSSDDDCSQPVSPPERAPVSPPVKAPPCDMVTPQKLQLLPLPCWVWVWKPASRFGKVTAFDPEHH